MSLLPRASWLRFSSARALLSALSLASALAGCAASKSSSAPLSETPERAVPSGKKPRLILWITIDQLPNRAFERERKKKDAFFRKTMESGRYFAAATYRHSNTETAPGHATLFTGTSPKTHGIVANEWWSETLGRVVPSTLDGTSPLLPATAEPVEKTGRSPGSLRASTIGDAMRKAYGDEARLFAISLKDRGAIFPAGRSGKAFWLAGGRFTTSRYYYETLPAWFDSNGYESRIGEMLAEGWSLLEGLETYEAKPTAPSLRAVKYWGPSFPHHMDAGAKRDEVLRASPQGDRIVLEIARRAVEAEGLGTDDVPDLLALSLSSNDYIGHYFGPETLEAEDLLRRVDVELDHFVSELEARVGRENLLVVFSSDHGGSESPEVSGSRFWTGPEIEAKVREALEEARKSLPGVEVPTLRAVVPPYVFLNRLGSGEHLSKEVCEKISATLLARTEGLEHAFCTSALLEKKGRSELEEAVAASMHPEVSGDLYLVFQERLQFLQDAKMVATHGSPWGYDRGVPILLRGAGVPAGRVEEAVRVDALAPTVGKLLGLEFPGDEGRVLPGFE